MIGQFETQLWRGLPFQFQPEEKDKPSHTDGEGDRGTKTSPQAAEALIEEKFGQKDEK